MNPQVPKAYFFYPAPWRATLKGQDLVVEFPALLPVTLTLVQARNMLVLGDFHDFPGYQGTAKHKDEATRILMAFVADQEKKP
jgi:hypothetical protein